jgi:hypothetical protein
MAAVVAGTGVMANGNIKFIDLATAIRFATWIMPPHRKEWAEAMLNEVAYVRTRRAAWSWLLGCTLFAVKERASYELARAFMPNGILKKLFTLSVASVIAVIGIYMMQKTYQRERILITLFHHGSSAAHHVKDSH